MFVLIWIQNVWYSDSVLERIFFVKVNFEKERRQTTKKNHEKLPSMQSYGAHDAKVDVDLH